MFKEELRPKAADAAPLCHRADHFHHGRVRRVLGRAVRHRDDAVRPARTSRFRCEVTDVNVAVLVIFAITSMGIYGIVLAGWSLEQQVLAARRPALVGADDQLRAVYGLALAAVIMLAGSLSLREIVMNQSGYWCGFIPQVVHLPAAARVLHLS